MATSQQQQAFVQTYGPYANQAGAKLGVSGNVILGHWAGESNWGTSNVAQTTGNLAGINLPGSTTGTNYASYSSPQQFTDAYVSTLSNPRYSSALNTGSDGTAFAQGLAKGGYFPQSSLANEQSFITSGAQTASQWNTGSSAVSTANASTGSYQTYDPETGLYSDSYGNQSLTPYTAVDSSGNTYDVAIAGGAGNASSNLGALGSSGTNYAQNTYVGSDGITTIDVTPSAGTATPATGTTAPNTGSTGSNTALLGSTMGYTPPASTGGPSSVGLSPGTVAQGTSWVNSIETAVGNWMTTAFKSAFGSVANWFERVALIVLAVILIALALWRLMDPDGSKTKRVMEGAMMAA